MRLGVSVVLYFSIICFGGLSKCTHANALLQTLLIKKCNLETLGLPSNIGELLRSSSVAVRIHVVKLVWARQNAKASRLSGMGATCSGAGA